MKTFVLLYDSPVALPSEPRAEHLFKAKSLIDAIKVAMSAPVDAFPWSTYAIVDDETGFVLAYVHPDSQRFTFTKMGRNFI